jgi:methylated-DNA-[protein]-cysteine S-methyltransferase
MSKQEDVAMPAAINDFESDIRAGRVRPDMSFNQKVWAMTARIPQGKLTTYGEIAKALGSKGSRAVGNALNKNPYAPGVPCHRVVGANGNLTGFAGGLDKKRELLRREGIACENGKVCLDGAMYRFPQTRLRT